VTFIDYIQEYKLPPGINPKNAEAIRILRHSKGYILVGNNLYKHGSASSILMKCVGTEEGRQILREIHEGVCRNHAASRTLVGKAFRSGFYGQLLWQMPKHSFAGAQTASSSANNPMSGSQPHHHTTVMTICMLGLGHDRASNYCAGWFYSCVDGHRQVYQMDRVQANHNTLCRSSD
jgi:hypothetical protein